MSMTVVKIKAKRKDMPKVSYDLPLFFYQPLVNRSVDLDSSPYWHMVDDKNGKTLNEAIIKLNSIRSVYSDAADYINACHTYDDAYEVLCEHFGGEDRYLRKVRQILEDEGMCTIWKARPKVKGKGKELIDSGLPITDYDVDEVIKHWDFWGVNELYEKAEFGDKWNDVSDLKIIVTDIKEDSWLAKRQKQKKIDEINAKNAQSLLTGVISDDIVGYSSDAADEFRSAITAYYRWDAQQQAEKAERKAEKRRKKGSRKYCKKGWENMFDSFLEEHMNDYGKNIIVNDEFDAKPSYVMGSDGNLRVGKIDEHSFARDLYRSHGPNFIIWNRKEAQKNPRKYAGEWMRTFGEPLDPIDPDVEAAKIEAMTNLFGVSKERYAAKAAKRDAKKRNQQKYIAMDLTDADTHQKAKEILYRDYGSRLLTHPEEELDLLTKIEQRIYRDKVKSGYYD